MLFVTVFVIVFVLRHTGDYVGDLAEEVTWALTPTALQLFLGAGTKGEGGGHARKKEGGTKGQQK
jgi:hypothetical protein